MLRGTDGERNIQRENREAKFKKGNAIVWWGDGAFGTITPCQWECRTIQELQKTGVSYKGETYFYPITSQFHSSIFIRCKGKQYTSHKTYTRISIAALFVNTTKWKQSNVHQQENGLKKLLKNATTWMNLKNTMLMNEARNKKV